MSYMMNILITFPANSWRDDVYLRKVHSVVVDTSFYNLTDKASIKLPRNIPLFNNTQLRELIAIGDAVRIAVGYNGSFLEVYNGYVTNISADIPVVIECEDAIWLLKQQPVNKSYETVKLQALLEDVQSSYNVDAFDVELGQVRLANTTVAGVLEWLKKEYGFYSFMRQGDLVCGKPYISNPVVSKFVMERNVRKSNLKYQGAEDRKVKLTARSTSSTGTKTEVTVGDDVGDQITVAFYNITSSEELEKLANEALSKYKRNGYTGTFDAFGLPLVFHGHQVEISSNQYNERNGTYYIGAVRYEYSPTAGLLQTIQPTEQV